MMIKKTKYRQILSRVILPALALAIVSTASPAKADPPHNWHPPGPPHYDNHVVRGHEWHEHERSAYYWRVHHPHPVPGYVYAPPVVYAAPPPPSGLSLFFPIHIN